MQCDRFEQRLNQLLDQRRSLDGDALLRHHAARCRQCRLLLNGYARVSAECASHASRQVAAPPNARLSAKSPWGRAVAAQCWTVGLSASLLLALIAASAWRIAPDSPTVPDRLRLAAGRLRDSPAHELPEAGLPAPETVEAVAAALELPSNAAAEDAASPQHEPLVSGAGAASLRWKLWLSLVESKPLTDARWIERVTGGLRPIADSLSSTFNVIRKSWAGGERRETEVPQASDRLAGYRWVS